MLLTLSLVNTCEALCFSVCSSPVITVTKPEGRMSLFLAHPIPVRSYILFYDQSARDWLPDTWWATWLGRIRLCVLPYCFLIFFHPQLHPLSPAVDFGFDIIITMLSFMPSLLPRLASSHEDVTPSDGGLLHPLMLVQIFVIVQVYSCGVPIWFLATVRVVLPGYWVIIWSACNVVRSFCLYYISNSLLLHIGVISQKTGTFLKLFLWHWSHLQTMQTHALQTMPTMQTLGTCDTDHTANNNPNQLKKQKQPLPVTK